MMLREILNGLKPNFIISHTTGEWDNLRIYIPSSNKTIEISYDIHYDALGEVYLTFNASDEILNANVMMQGSNINKHILFVAEYDFKEKI